MADEVDSSSGGGRCGPQEEGQQGKGGDLHCVSVNWIRDI